MDQHPTQQRLEQWLAGRLNQADSDAIKAHVATCEDGCATIVERLHRDEVPLTAVGAPSVEPTAIPIGVETLDQPNTIGRFRIERTLGEGGFGRVFLAHDDQLNRPVAIKVPRRDRFSPASLQEYQAEARVLAGLDHPNIVPIHDVGTSDDGLFFLVSKLIEGSDLAHRIKHARPTPDITASLIADIADALHYAHSKGLVHRDIKPGNILLDGAGKPYVADFGLALKEEDVGRGARYVGTVAYMSPEQARGEGHRVDGRSDIFSLGVVFYEMLVGKRPFKGATQAELIEQITGGEPRPPRQLDDTIPKELERICLKAISKRASERYLTAKDMAEDLRHFLAEHVSGSKKANVCSTRTVDIVAPAVTAPVESLPSFAPSMSTAPVLTSDSQYIKIIPKGLRSFDGHDAEFFLELLPGPRDRDGLPDSLRFWKTRVEETDADHTFPVGLIYGPSGCGKSSLVKAGLLPHLSDKIIAVYIEATAEETESRLLTGLRKRCPTLPANLNLKDTLAALRRGQGIPFGKKVLIVIDQFEQWLHAKRVDANTELAQALRQCDGGRLQCIIMVRDDFWLAVSRFTRKLEVRLLEGHNSALADLFDIDHAKKVLAAFGRAFGKLPANPGDISKEQRDFLHQAVFGLAQEDKVICVRLALFAEMMKGKPWTPSTLKEVGGAAGVGVTFLEETFAASTAPPQHRFHLKPAQAVLKVLLPEAGTDIKGHMRSQQELLEASGYAARPRDFDDLVAILDGELRLITPTDPEGETRRQGDKETGRQEDVKTQQPATVGASVSVSRYYQLTHDYLVHSLREWLTRKQKESRRGRAELRLAERALAWNAKPENRHLPACWEWLAILMLTRKADWTRPQRKMMRSARWYHVIRGSILALALTLIGWGSYEVYGTIEARGLRDRLLDASITDVPAVVRDMAPYHRWTAPLLHDALKEAKAKGDSRRQLRASLALLPQDPDQLGYLYDRLLDAEPQEAPVLIDALQPAKQEFVQKLWSIAESPPRGKERQRLRAARALATFDRDNTRWNKISRAVTEQLVAENPVHLSLWMEGFRPVRLRLLPPLTGIFKDRSPERTAERSVATSVLADYAQDEPSKLAELIEFADDKQFAVLFPLLEAHKDRIVSAMDITTATPLESQPTEGDKEILAKSQANAAVTLLRMGHGDKVWPMFKHSPDPRVRSYLIHRLSPLGADPKEIIARLEIEKDASIRRALLLCLGDFGVSLDHEALLPRVWALYRDDPDAGMHGAAEWLLRVWGQQARLKEFNNAWAKDPSKREVRLKQIARDLTKGEGFWHISSQGQTMLIIPGPVEFDMGSPSSETSKIGGREAELEKQHKKKINRTFAISRREVTAEQFRRFNPDHKELSMAYSPTDDCPVNAVSWYQAAAYCNWLSKEEGLEPDQWCYVPNDKGKYAEGMRLAKDAYKRTGYRLPTEAEWEYACRARATTSRYYGESDELLGKYAWYEKNASDRGMLPGVPGQLGVPGDSLKPNDFGMFNMLGNALEWCQDRMAPYQPGEDTEDIDPVKDKDSRVMRGGALTNPARYLRSAVRSEFVPTSNRVNLGFRVARTIAVE